VKPVTARSIRLGIIGGGMMSQVGHLPFYLADSRCEVVAIWETRPSLVAWLAPRVRAAKIVASPREIFDDPTIDAVIVIAPRPAMAPLALAALRAGKHVLMEKPMAHNVEQARRLVDAARAAGKTLAIGFMKRHDPGIEAARRIFAELIATKRVGRCVLARFYNFSNGYAVPVPPHRRPSESRAERLPEWPSWPDWLQPRLRDRYAWFMNSASHNINLLNLFFDEAAAVTSVASAGENALTAIMTSGDTPIAFELAKCAPGAWIEGIEILFERGRLAVAIPSPMATDQASRITFQDGIGADAAVSVDVESGWSFERQAQDFLTALSDGRAPGTSGDEGLRDLELCERIWRRISEEADG
jgi:predicted dehydrogenase